MDDYNSDDEFVFEDEDEETETEETGKLEDYISDQEDEDDLNEFEKVYLWYMLGPPRTVRVVFQHGKDQAEHQYEKNRPPRPMRKPHPGCLPYCTHPYSMVQ